MFDLEGKVAVVTGSASGIGLQYVNELLKNGLKGITVADINETVGIRTVTELQKRYGKDRVIFEKLDVCCVDQFEVVFKKTVEKFQNVDILINNAGMFDDREWEKQVLINLNGTINGTLLALHNYIKTHKSGPEGVIVNISSRVGIDISIGCPVYCATKHGVTAFSRSIGRDLYYNLNKVRVFCVCPGPMDTNLMVGWEDKTLKPEYATELKKLNLKMGLQSPLHLAQDVVQLIKTAACGSVWLIDKVGKPEEVEFPLLTNMLTN